MVYLGGRRARGAVPEFAQGVGGEVEESGALPVGGVVEGFEQVVQGAGGGVRGGGGWGG